MPIPEIGQRFQIVYMEEWRTWNNSIYVRVDKSTEWYERRTGISRGAESHFICQGLNSKIYFACPFELGYDRKFKIPSGQQEINFGGTLE